MHFLTPHTPMAREPYAPVPGIDLSADAAPVAHQARRVRLLLRDQRLLDGLVHVPEDGDLASFLSTREGGWVNVTDVRWLASGERVAHLVLKASVVLWAGAAAGGDALLPRLGEGTPRPVKITLENRVTLHAELRLPVRHRLTDVLTACGDFFPVCDARVDARGIAFGDIAVNRDAVHVVEDLGEMPAADQLALEADVTATYFAADAGLIVDPFRPVTLDELELAAVSKRPAAGYAASILSEERPARA